MNMVVSFSSGTSPRATGRPGAGDLRLAESLVSPPSSGTGAALHAASSELQSTAARHGAQAAYASPQADPRCGRPTARAVLPVASERSNAIDDAARSREAVTHAMDFSRDRRVRRS